MATGAIKITKKGQVTIPKKIRDKLKSSAVYFDIIDDEVVVRGVKDAAGSLQQYSKNAKPSSMKEMKEKAWEKAVHEKTGKKSS